jgi:hypothetical protein
LNSINGLGIGALNMTNFVFRIKDFDVTVCYKDVPNNTIFFSNAKINELPNNRDDFLVAMLKMLID